MDKIAIIGCSKKKLCYKTQARLLYNSPLFKKIYKYCEQNFDDIFILSSKYGLIHKNEVIKPYDKYIGDLTKTEKKIWVKKVKNQIKEKIGEADLYFFCGRKYHEQFEGQKPLDGKKIGQILQWLDSQELKKPSLFDIIN